MFEQVVRLFKFFKQDFFATSDKSYEFRISKIHMLQTDYTINLDFYEY